MKKLDRKGLFKIISATSMVIFSLIVSFSGAIAWYQSIRSVRDTGDQFEVIDSGTSVTAITVHEFYGKSETDFDSVTTEVDHSSGMLIPNYSLPANTRYVHIKTTSTPANELTFLLGGNSITATQGEVIDIDGKIVLATNCDFVIDLSASGLIAESDLGNTHTLSFSYTRSDNDFSITVARYETPYFAFNHEGTILYGEGVNNSQAIQLGEYSLEDPDHPVLLLFRVEGVQTRIELETKYPFLGNKKSNYIKYIVNTKAELNAITGMSEGDFAEVLYYKNNQNDNNEVAKDILFKYVSSSWTDANINADTFSDLNNNAVIDKTNLSNGDYVRVNADEDKGGVSSIYRYNSNKKAFEIKWLDLGIEDEQTRHFTNPLSSVTQFSYFEFEEDVTDEDNLTTLDVYERNNQGSLVLHENRECIAINKADITASNTVSFADCSNFSNPGFDNPICVYDDDARDYYYIGVVVNYYSLALECIFSNNLGHEALTLAKLADRTVRVARELMEIMNTHI